MTDVTATEAARQFSELLDAVEHDGERFTITRHGKPVAHIEPAARGQGTAFKDLLRRNRPDPAWAEELADLRELVPVQERA
jgi:prevent-host-death family protein